MQSPQKKFKISASSFYNLSKCQRRVYMDLHGEPSEKGEYSDFMQLLWDRGVQIEEEIINSIKAEHVVISVEGFANEETFQTTLTLMKKGIDWIYQGVLIFPRKSGHNEELVLAC